MRSLLALSVSMALAACAEQQPKQDAAPEQTGIDNSLAARLSKSDPTICSDEAVQRLVVLKTLTELDQQAAEKYQLLLDNGGSLEFVGVRMTGAQPEISEVTCSATLRGGFSQRPFPFTYALRPDDTGSEVVVDPTGRIDRWFHFRGAVISKLAEMGLFEAPNNLAPQADLEPLAEPEPQTEPYEVPSEDAQQVPMNGAGAEPDAAQEPPVTDWNGVRP